MPRSGAKVFRKRKMRPGPGRGHTNEPSEIVQENVSSPEHSDGETVSQSDMSTSSSHSKMSHNLSYYDGYSSQKINDIIDISILTENANDFLVCKDCHGSITFSVVQRIGLASKIKLECEECLASKKFMGTKPVVTNLPGMYPVFTSFLFL